MPNPPSFLEHLNALGYHPRSNKHSNALAAAIVFDLVRHCPAIKKRAAAGLLVYDLNIIIMSRTSEANIDLVLGPPPLGAEVKINEGSITRAHPSNIEIAVELKTVATEHRKAIKNRKRDLEAHHQHVHNYNQRAIAAAVLVVNVAETFRSPLRVKEELTRHKKPLKLLDLCINEARGIKMRGSISESGLDAKCVIVVDFDNVNPTAKYFEQVPAPTLGDPLYYDAFIRTICDLYSTRYGHDDGG